MNKRTTANVVVTLHREIKSLPAEVTKMISDSFCSADNTNKDDQILLNKKVGILLRRTPRLTERLLSSINEPTKSSNKLGGVLLFMYIKSTKKVGVNANIVTPLFVWHH